MDEENLPMGWKSSKLGDITQMVMGQSPPSNTYNENRIGLPFLQGKADFTESFPRPTKWCTMPLKIAAKGSVLISVRAPVGDVNLADQDYIIGRGLSSISIDNGDNKFLFYSLIQNKSRINAQGSGTTFQSINKATLENFRILLPPPPEQHAIARALRAVQGAREARLREVALERERKAALMEHLFTKGTRGEVTKMTEIGEMPEIWQVVKLGEVIASTQYGLSVCGNSEGNYPILRMNCLVESRVNDSNLQFVDLTKTDFENFRLNKGDILFNRTNSSDLVGKTGLFNLEGDFVFASYLIRITVDKTQLSPEFINYYINMNSTQTRLRMLASRGVSQSNINATKLKGFIIPLPQFPEQQAIAIILRACDSRIAALDHEARLLEELFRAMLEELMSGRLQAGALVEDAA